MRIAHSGLKEMPCTSMNFANSRSTMCLANSILLGQVGATCCAATFFIRSKVSHTCHPFGQSYHTPTPDGCTWCIRHERDTAHSHLFSGSVLTSIKGAVIHHDGGRCGCGHAMIFGSSALGSPNIVTKKVCTCARVPALVMIDLAPTRT